MADDDLDRKIALAESAATFFRLLRDGRFTAADLRHFEATERRAKFTVVEGQDNG